MYFPYYTLLFKTLNILVMILLLHLFQVFFRAITTTKWSSNDFANSIYIFFRCFFALTTSPTLKTSLRRQIMWIDWPALSWYVVLWQFRSPLALMNGLFLFFIHLKLQIPNAISSSYKWFMKNKHFREWMIWLTERAPLNILWMSVIFIWLNPL